MVPFPSMELEFNIPLISGRRHRVNRDHVGAHFGQWLRVVVVVSEDERNAVRLSPLSLRNAYFTGSSPVDGRLIISTNKSEV
jgi:hypothetical protein